MLKKKRNSITIIVMSLLVVLSAYAYIPAVEAAISNVTTLPGAVNCIIEFDCEVADVIYIKYGVSYPLEFQTYTDPTDMNSWDRGDHSHRWMVLRSLNESTTYRYDIYVGGANTSSGSFTTKPRFTTSYADEFLDEYLWDASSGIDIYQSVGVKSPPAGGADPDYDFDGIHPYINSNGTFDIWWCVLPATNQKLIADWNKTSINPAESYDQARIVYVMSPYYDEIESRWISDGCGYISDWALTTMTSNNKKSWSSDNATNVVTGMMGNFDVFSDEQAQGLFNDSLGANKWGDYSLRHRANVDDRHIGWFIGKDDLNWTAWNNACSGNDWHGSFSGTFDMTTMFTDQGGMYANDSYPLMTKCRNGIYVGLWSSYAESTTDTLELYLASSRDGVYWNFTDSLTPLVPNGAGGTWDDAKVWFGKLVWDNDTDYITYVGEDTPHEVLRYIRDLGLMTFRLNGLSYVKPTGSSGWLRTISIPGEFRYNFTVNGNFTSSAKLNISVVNATTGNVYDGFGFSDFDTITTDNISITPTWGGGGKNLSYIPTGAFKINFSWDGAGSGELYGYMLGAGEDQQQDSPPQFITIEGGTNGTTIYDPTPTFNWTIAIDVSQYHLQVSNTSGDWTDSALVVNLSDINIHNYPGSYSENATRVSFTLPNEYALTVEGTYYCRVRAYVKGAG